MFTSTLVPIRMSLRLPMSLWQNVRAYFVLDQDDLVPQNCDLNSNKKNYDLFLFFLYFF